MKGAIYSDKKDKRRTFISDGSRYYTLNIFVIYYLRDDELVLESEPTQESIELLEKIIEYHQVEMMLDKLDSHDDYSAKEWHEELKKPAKSIYDNILKELEKMEDSFNKMKSLAEYRRGWKKYYA